MSVHGIINVGSITNQRMPNLDLSTATNILWYTTSATSIFINLGGKKQSAHHQPWTATAAAVVAATPPGRLKDDWSYEWNEPIQVMNEKENKQKTSCEQVPQVGEISESKVGVGSLAWS